MRKICAKISLWSGEDGSLIAVSKTTISQHDVRQNAIKPQLLQQLPVNPPLCSPPIHSLPHTFFTFLFFFPLLQKQQ